MSTLITNLPSYEVWVRKEYLTDHKSGHGEFVKGVWVYLLLSQNQRRLVKVNQSIQYLHLRVAIRERKNIEVKVDEYINY